MRRYIYVLIALLMCTMTLQSPAWAKDKFVVVIDPGHGGGDIGTPHRKGKQDEKTIALNVGLRLGRMIESNYSDVKVVYTRKTDHYPSLPERTQIAKKAKGDLFISIHVNACPTASVHGFETFVFGTEGSDSGKRRIEERMVEERENLDISGKLVNFDTDIDIETKILCQAQREKHNKQSQDVARYVHNAILSGVKKTSYAGNVSNRGIKAKNLFVLCYSPMPAILVELGYMSNAAEEKFINTEEAQNCFASALFSGFAQYKRDWDKRQLKNADKQVPAVEPKPEPAPKQEPTPKAEPEKKPEAKPAQQAQPTGNEVWKIQFMSSDRLLKEGDRELKGLKPVSYYREGKLYKYTYGSGASTKELSAEMKKVKAVFPEAFFVKFDEKGNRVK